MPKKVEVLRNRADSRISGEVRRLNDLRKADLRHAHDLRKVDLRRADDLRTIERYYRRLLTKAETKRVDALLAADRANVGLAAARAEIVATNLAERVDTTAKTAAMNVESSATAVRAATDASAQVLAGRITPLEQAQWGNVGSKSQHADDRRLGQWTTERILFLIGLGLGLLYFVLSQMGVPGA